MEIKGDKNMNKNENLHEMTEEQLSEVAGGKKIERYKFYDIGTKSQKAYVEIEDGKLKSSWGIDSLNERDIEQLLVSDNIKKELGIL